MKTQLRIIAAAVVLSVAPAIQAQVPAPSELNGGQNLVATRIANNFTELAGGEDNALALVNALRSGGDVTLVTAVPPPAGSPTGTPPTITETTFAVPTRPMGWGNVKHALALAQDQLARAGITDPTAAQLQTALMGGDLVVTNADGTTTTTAVRGVLTMRADGMGWGNIAKAGGTTLGAVTSKVDMSAKSIKSPAATTATSTITTAAGNKALAPAAKSGKGITTATGATASHGSRGLVTASGASANASPQGNALGRGIVTGAGGGSTTIATTGAGRGHGAASGAGLVTASGGSVSASGVLQGNNAGANGNGKGNAGGNGRGKGG